MGRFRIHDRIVIPFALIALMATAAAALLSASLISNVLESRVEAQIAKGSALVSQAQFALNPSILHLVKDIVDAEVITYSREGTPLASTVDPQAHPDLVRRVIAEQPPEADVVPGGRYVLRRMDSNGTPYIVAYRRAVERPGTLIAFASNQSEVMSALRIARRAILMTAGFSLLLLIAVTRLVARRVTAPFEELLATSQDALVRSEKLAVTGLLAARVAHDVRNPLSSIKMQTQLLKLRLRDDRDSQTVLQAILHDIEQVEGVVRGLLHLARPGELNLTRARLPDLVDDLLHHLSPQMAHRNIAVETRIDDGIPPVSIDVDRFKQALLNLIGNATDAMPEGGALQVAVARSPDGSTVILDVCDTGTGIDPSIADRLFDPFVSTKRDGVGLGLVNTKATVESHGGTIHLTPREGGGTRARITLPTGA